MWLLFRCPLIALAPSLSISYMIQGWGLYLELFRAWEHLPARETYRRDIRSFRIKCRHNMCFTLQMLKIRERKWYEFHYGAVKIEVFLYVFSRHLLSYAILSIPRCMFGRSSSFAVDLFPCAPGKQALKTLRNDKAQGTPATGSHGEGVGRNIQSCALPPASVSASEYRLSLSHHVPVQNSIASAG